MSDTPKTDQAKIAAGFQAVPESFLVFARKLERENAALRAIANRLIKNNGGPLQWDEAIERDSEDDYVMVKVQDFEALCAALDAAREETKL